MGWYHRFIIQTILEFFPDKNREFLIKILKFSGWTLLVSGFISIFIGYTTSEPQSGFSGLGNVILFLGGIICCMVGLSFISGWFSVWQSGSLYDYDYEHSSSGCRKSITDRGCMRGRRSEREKTKTSKRV